jgi:hypothetical protein
MKTIIILILAALSALAQSTPPGGGKVAAVVGPRATPPATCSYGQLWNTSTVLTWCNSSGAWVSLGGSSSTAAPYALAFSAATTATALVATHGQGTSPLDGGCYQTSDGARVEYNTWTRNGSGDVTVTFTGNFTGSCMIFNGAGGGGSGATYTAGAGIDITGGVISAATATTPSYLTGTASLSFSTFSGDGTCEEQNITVSGAVAGDAVGVGLPVAFPAGIIQGAAWITAPNTVTLRLCRLAGTSTISAQTFRAWVNKTF